MKIPADYDSQVKDSTRNLIICINMSSVISLQGDKWVVFDLKPSLKEVIQIKRTSSFSDNQI